MTCRLKTASSGKKGWFLDWTKWCSPPDAWQAQRQQTIKVKARTANNASIMGIPLNNSILKITKTILRRMTPECFAG